MINITQLLKILSFLYNKFDLLFFPNILLGRKDISDENKINKKVEKRSSCKGFLYIFSLSRYSFDMLCIELHLNIKKNNHMCMKSKIDVHMYLW